MNNFENVPEAFKCPITLEIMVDPVNICTGHTFERAAIEDYFERGGTVNPLCNGEALTSFILTPNYSLRHCIEMWRLQQEQQMFGVGPQGNPFFSARRAVEHIFFIDVSQHRFSLEVSGRFCL